VGRVAGTTVIMAVPVIFTAEQQEVEFCLTVLAVLYAATPRCPSQKLDIKHTHHTNRLPTPIQR